MPFVAGPYTATYRGTILGITERGWELEHTWFGEPVIGDNLGDSIQDHVYRGGNCFWSAILSEWDRTQARTAFWPYNALLGESGQVGRMDTDVMTTLGGTGGLVLTAVPGTRADVAGASGPKTVTMTYAVIAKNFPIRTLFAAAHRKVGIRMQSYPDDAQQGAQSGSQGWFAVA